MPYRASETKAPKAPLGDTGLVGEIIRQFADRLAFYRELVQNSLDAGASRIDVRLLWEGHADDPDADGTLHVSVVDDGEGMTRDILENRLLVLFRSGKEGQVGKIGKFGIGFSSVLALSPTVVSIHTTRPPDDRWTLELHPDLSYDLFAREGNEERGTTVTLRLPMKRGSVEEFVRRSVESVSRWCRHARVPITVRCFVAGNAEPLVERRIDEPFGLDAPVKVQVGGKDGQRLIVVGVPADGHRYAGFFKHGLTLLETDEAFVGTLAFKVQDPSLEHTLSRDNVRRDAAFEATIAAVKEVAEGPLLEAAAIELRKLVHDADRAGWARAALAIHASGIDISPSAFSVPKLALDGTRDVTSIAWIKKHDAAIATYASPIVERALARGVTVIDGLTHGLTGLPAHAVRALLQQRAGKPLVDVERAVSVVTRAMLEGGDATLVERTAALLASCGAPVNAVWLVRVEGARFDAPCLAVPRAFAATTDPHTVVLAAEAAACPMQKRNAGILAMNVEHDLVRLARQRAHERPAVAAASFARVALLTWGMLDAKRGSRLTEAALDLALPGAR